MTTVARAVSADNFRVEGCTSHVVPSGAPRQDSAAVPVARPGEKTMGTVAMLPATTRLALEWTGRDGRAGESVVGAVKEPPRVVLGRPRVSAPLVPVPDTDAVTGFPPAVM